MFKRSLFVLAVLLLLAQVVYADSISTQINNQFEDCMGSTWIQSIMSWSSPGKYAECKGKSYQVLFESSGIGSQLTTIPHRWIPVKGKVTISDYFILVQFKLDDEMLAFFNTKFINSNARLPIGLEIDIAALNNDVFREAGSVIGLGLPDDVGLFLDTSAFDSHPSYGAVIRNPHRLEANNPYAIVFFVKDAPWYAPWQDTKLIQSNGQVKFSFQVSIDSSRAEQMVASYDGGDHQLNGYSNEGNGGPFDYFVVQSDPYNEMSIPSEATICWYAKSGDDIGCDAGNPFQDSVAEGVASAGAVSQELVNSGVADFPQGNVAIPAQGPGGASTLTDQSNPSLPDFMVSKIWLEDLNGNETYTFDRGDEIKIRMILKNIGSDDIPGSDTITTRIYLSDGYKVDPSDNWIRIGNETTLGSELDPGETHSETEYFKLWEESHIQVGNVYNLVVCVDRTADHNNGSGAYVEEHESNNCSTEAVFTVSQSAPLAPKRVRHWLKVCAAINCF